MSGYEGVPASALAGRLAVPECLVLRKVTSTLDILHELAQDGAPAGTLVLAEEQAAGRGRQGRQWQSSPGAGIWLAYLIRPETTLQSGVLSLRVGLAVVGALGDLGVEAKVKWPNDVMAGARKLAGILGEGRWVGSRLSWIALGIGINVHGPIPSELTDRAVAVAELSPGVSRLDVLDKLAPRLHDLSDRPDLTASERAAFARYDWLAQRSIVEPVAGQGHGVDSDGALLIKTAGGVERVVGGSVVPA